jgi:hypothetical protein
MTYKPSSSSLTNQFWSQATWFIDPANFTGFASDNNTGLDATHPVLSYNGGVVAKWGTNAPLLRQNTTLTWLSTQPDDTDPVIFLPVMVGFIVTVQAQLTASQLVHSGALSSVVLLDRATGQLLQADLGFAATPGQLIKNTTAGKTSYAWVYKNVTGTTFLISQPYAPAAPPDVNPPAQVTNWANGDTYALYEPTGVNLVRVSPTIAEFDSDGDLFPAQVQIYQLRGMSADGVIGDNNFYLGNDVAVTESSFDTIVVSESAGNDDEVCDGVNLYLGAGVYNTTGANQISLQIVGGVTVQSIVPGACSWTFFGDAIVDVTGTGPGISLTLGSSVVAGGGRCTILDSVYIAGTIGLQSVVQCGGFGGPIYGPGTLDSVGTARILYPGGAGAAAVTFLNAGGLKVNGQSTAWAVTTGDPAVWHGGRALTAANLDATIAGGGFGGLATNIGGATFTNQNTV